MYLKIIYSIRIQYYRDFILSKKENTSINKVSISSTKLFKTNSKVKVKNYTI